MPSLNKTQVLERFRKDGRNSSHFIWLLAELEFFETEDRWIFAYTRIGSVTLFALEPLIPDAPVEYTPAHGEAFARGWQELQLSLRLEICAFVSVYRPFLKLLEKHGFQTVKAGQEPWVKLQDCIPTGNAGKGVRSARNQALSSGLTVEEWKASEIQADPAKRQLMEEIYREWSSAHLVNLTGFMNATDPFAHMEQRRYFSLRSPKRVEAYLVATPVPGIQGYFLEDLVLRSQAPRGAGELLTLEAMVALRDSGVQVASLGVVAMTTLDTSAAVGVPPVIRKVMKAVVELPKYLGFLYNFGGMETYRKRFKPEKWEAIHLAVRNLKPGTSDARAWLLVLLAIRKAFRPRLHLTWNWLSGSIVSPLRRYPLTSSVALVIFTLFAMINRFGNLPESTLSQFGFSASAPFYEWFYRSIVSDFLYFDPWHFWGAGMAYLAVLAWAERKHRLSFLLPLFATVTVFDDFLNYALVIRPFSGTEVFNQLVRFKDVGGSLGLVTILGLQICQFRKIREPVFALTIMGAVFYYVISAGQLETFKQLPNLVLNLDHALFLMIGFLIGKLRFEQLRRANERASKGKPPIARSALPATPKAQQQSEAKKAA